MSTYADILSVVQSATNLLMVNPQQDIGILPDLGESFFFHFNGEESVTLTSDITDHFIEDNTSIQDNIALRPEIVTTQGFIGELNNVPPGALALLQAAANKLTSIDAYVPQLSVDALIAYNTAFQAYQAASTAVQAVENIASAIGLLPTSQNLQQQAFHKFYQWWQARQLFTIQTPWAVFQDMAIQTIRAVQGEDTRTISTFEITFKQMRFYVDSSQVGKAYLGRAANQIQGVTNLGYGSLSPGPSLTSMF